MTVNAVERLTRYRSSHRIKVVDRDYTRCAIDEIRVHPNRGGGWRHDTSEIAALIKAEYGGAWPSRRVAEDAIAAAVASDIAREDAFDRGRLTFDWHGHAVDVDIADDDEWTNREGMPEFNGSFR